MNIREAAQKSERSATTVRRRIHQFQDTNGRAGLKAHQPHGSRKYIIQPEDFDRWINGLPPQ